MDSVSIGELTSNFADRYDMPGEDLQKLNDVFGSLQDLTDSALKILVPMMLSYCNVDGNYPGTEKYLVAQIVDNRLKITVNVPIGDLSIVPGDIGRLVA